MSEVWHFYVGFRSLLQKNCAIWTIPKGNGLWIVPCPLFFLCRQTAQSKPKTKNYIINVVANHYIRSFVMWFFISSPLYTILADLRSFLESKKDQAKYFHLIFFKTLYISGYHPDNQLIKISPVSINYFHLSPLPTPLNKKHFPKNPKTVNHSPDIY